MSIDIQLLVVRQKATGKVLTAVGIDDLYTDVQPCIPASALSADDLAAVQDQRSGDSRSRASLSGDSVNLAPGGAQVKSLFCVWDSITIQIDDFVLSDNGNTAVNKQQLPD